MTTIVGRASEIERIRQLIDEPDATALAIQGEPGIGKSTLLAVAATRAEQQGRAVLRADADEIASTQPFGLLQTLLGDRWAGAHASLPPLAVVDVAIEAIDAIAADRGAPLLVLDNLQWADPGSLRVLTSVVRRTVALGWRAIVAMRLGAQPEPLARLLDAIVELGGTDLVLAPLSAVEVVALTRVQLGAPPTSALRRAVEQAGGNPFYVTTLLRELQHEQRLRSDDREVTIAAGSTSPSLGRMLVRRAHDLGDDTCSMLQAAALMGRTTRLDTLAELLGRNVDDLIPQVRAAVDASLVDASPDELTFRHDLVAAALRDHTPAPERTALHRRALAVLRSSETRPDRLAPHLLALPVEAVDPSELIAVADACSTHIGLQLVDRALATGEPSVQLAVKRAELLLWNGQPHAAIDEAERLLALHEGDPRVEPAAAVRSHALFLIGRGNDVSASAADDLDPGVTTMTNARYKAEIALPLLFSGQADRAFALAEAAIALNAASPARDAHVTEATARAVRGFVQVARGRITQGLADLERCTELIGEGTAETGFAGPELFRASACLIAGDLAAASAAVERDDRGQADYASVVRLPARHAIRSAVLYERGDWDSALEEVHAATVLTDELGVAVVSNYGAAVSAMVHVQRGDLAAAQRSLSTGLGGGAGAEWIGLAHAMVAEAAGDLDTARVIASFTIDGLGALGFVTMQAQLAPRLARLYAHHPDDLAAFGQRLDAITVDGHAPAVEARIRWAQAWVQRSADHAAAAADALAQLGYSADADAARRDAELLSGAPPSSSAPDPRAATKRRGSTSAFGWEAITTSESNVLDLLAEGLDNGSIAQRLFVSRRTVESHLSHVYTKLGVSGRSRLVREVLRRRGLD